MDKEQNQKNNMYKKVLAFFVDNAAKFAGFKRLVTEIKKFGDLNGVLDDFIKKQLLGSVGLTGEKANVFISTVALTVRTARKALVYAKDQKDEVLKALFDVRESDFYDEEANDIGKIKLPFFLD